MPVVFEEIETVIEPERTAEPPPAEPQDAPSIQTVLVELLRRELVLLEARRRRREAD